MLDNAELAIGWQLVGIGPSAVLAIPDCTAVPCCASIVLELAIAR